MWSALLLASVTISLPARVDVGGTELTLGDLAHVAGQSEEVARVSAVELGYTPAPGYSRLFDRRVLEQRLRRDIPGVQITWSGAPHCRVHPKVETLPGTRLTEVARKELLQLFAGNDIEVQLERAAVDLTIPRGEQPARLVPVLQGRSLRGGTWSIPVQVLVDNEVYQTVWTSWKVAFWQTRPVLKRPVPRGQILDASMFEEKRVQVFGNSKGALPEPGILEAAVALRDLPAGGLVGLQDVKRPQVVRRGDRLTLEVRRGVITASTSVIAMSNARIGDRLVVRTSDNQREVQATLVTRELAQIKLP